MKYGTDTPVRASPRDMVKGANVSRLGLAA